MSVNSTNPSQLFGGTWEQISGRFLYCTTTSKTTGGSTTTGSTTLTIDQIPSHTHSWYAAIDGGNNVGRNIDRFMLNGWGEARWWGNLYKMDNTGGGQGHTHPQNLPPYFTVYCWYRVS